MANKKLKVEVELETAKAKRQAKALEGVGGEGISTVSPSADRASRQIRDLGRAAEGTQVNMKAAGKAFAGMAVGLAAGYAAKNMKEGTARTAVEYGAGAIQGAAMGMMFGPIGAAIGALGGTLKTYLDRDSSIKKMTEDFAKADDDYEENRLWQAQLRRLSDVEESPVGMDDKDVHKDQLAKVEEKLYHSRLVAEKLFDDQNKLIKRINGYLKNGETDQAEVLQARLSTIRTRKEQAEALERSFSKQKKSIERQIEEDSLKGETNPRVSMTGTDALAKVGGFSTPSMKAAAMSFSGPSSETVSKAIQSATEKSAKHTQEMVDTLKEIAQNTKGGETWQ